MLQSRNIQDLKWFTVNRQRSEVDRLMLYLATCHIVPSTTFVPLDTPNDKHNGKVVQTVNCIITILMTLDSVTYQVSDTFLTLSRVGGEC